MGWLPAVFVAAAIAGLVAHYMRRPPERPLRLASARFIGDLTPASNVPIRFSPSIPLRRWRFFLRLLILCAALVALFLDARGFELLDRPRLGIRLVVDTSASMAVSAGAASRAAEAQRVVGDLLTALDGWRRTSDVCLSAVAVDAETRPLAEVDLRRPEAYAPRPIGGSPRSLVAAALADDERCAVTHAIIVTDRPKMVSRAVTNDRLLIWRQVGAPAGNVAIRQVTADVDPLASVPPTIRALIVRYGDVQPPRSVQVTGPDAAPIRIESPDWSIGGPHTIRFQAPRAGPYTITLDGGGAFDGDDRAQIEIPPIVGATVDWRLTDFARPAGLRAGTGTDAILVASANDALEASATRRAVLTVGPLRPSAGSRRIGVFASDDPLLEDLNLELLDSGTPQGIEHARIEIAGFQSVVSDEPDSNGTYRDIVARRVSPPAAIIPLPDRSAPSDYRNAALVGFFNAMRLVTADMTVQAKARWVRADGTEFADADLESDTAEDVSPADRDVSIEPVRGAARQAGVPLWPWLIVALLALFALERWRGVSWKAAV